MKLSVCFQWRSEIRNVFHELKGESKISQRYHQHSHVTKYNFLFISPSPTLVPTTPPPPPPLFPFVLQLAAQVLDDFDDEDIGFGLVDEKKDSAVAKKLGKLASH